MEINCGSVNLTTLEQSLLNCAGGEAALTDSLVSVGIETHLVASLFTQEYTKMLAKHPKLRGDQCISSPCKPQDVEDDEDDDEGEGDDAAGEENGNPIDGNRKGDQNGLGEVEENGGNEDEEDEQGQGDNPNDDDDDDDDDEEEDDSEDDDVDDEEEDDPDSNEDDEEEEDDEDQQPPKKRKK